MELPQFQRLVGVVEKLLDPKDGCPWDLKQTHESLLEFLIEESYEFIHATEEKNLPHMEEELGDVLLQVLLHSAMANKKGSFSLESVAAKLADKLVYRHPHVFGELQGQGKISSEQVLSNWETLKEEKKKEEGKHSGEKIDASLLSFPALFSAWKIGKKTAKLAFDWDHYSQVMYKVEEEWQELKEELPPGGEFNHDRVAEEMGDLLFSMAQLARHLKVNPEEMLRQANRKFIERFNMMEGMLDSKELRDLSNEDKEQLWMRAKMEQRKRKSGK